jgi:NAD(P)-dependent dehydrogenase (short-subunit alcohol dehydrogenase family)
MTRPMVQDKVMVVTGAGGGIGRDMALALAAEGARVAVNDIGTSTRGEGWTAQAIAEHGMPALKASFIARERSTDVFSWDPV